MRSVAPTMWRTGTAAANQMPSAPQVIRCRGTGKGGPYVQQKVRCSSVLAGNVTREQAACWHVCRCMIPSITATQ